MSLKGKLFAAGHDWYDHRLEAKGTLERRRQLVGSLTGEVLEIGAGTGLNFRHYDQANRVAALEPEPDMRARAVRRADRASVPIEVIDGDAMALPFPDASFDAVVACLVLCTIPEPDRALAEAHRVLKVGGTLRFWEHVRANDERLARRQDRWSRPWQVVGSGCHPNRATVPVIGASGFHIETIESFDQAGEPSIVRPQVIGVAVRV